jgi:hypothetical protein
MRETRANSLRMIMPGQGTPLRILVQREMDFCLIGIEYR